jgi:hypothetical protein
VKTYGWVVVKIAMDSKDCIEKHNFRIDTWSIEKNRGEGRWSRAEVDQAIPPGLELDAKVELE